MECEHPDKGPTPAVALTNPLRPAQPSHPAHEPPPEVLNNPKCLYPPCAENKCANPNRNPVCFTLHDDSRPTESKLSMTQVNSEHFLSAAAMRDCLSEPSQVSSNPAPKLSNPDNTSITFLPSDEVSSPALEQVSPPLPCPEPRSSATTSPGHTPTSIMATSPTPSPPPAEPKPSPTVTTQQQPNTIHTHLPTSLSPELATIQTLRRRTQSTPISASLDTAFPTVPTPVLSPMQPDLSVESVITPDEADVEESVTTETLYRLHSKAPHGTARDLQGSVSEPPKLPPGPALEVPSLSSSAASERGGAAAGGERGLLDYTRFLLGLDEPAAAAAAAAGADGGSDTLEDAWSVATKRRGVYNLVQVPIRLERLLSFVGFICADEFLSVFTILPLRALLALLALLWHVARLPLRALRRARAPPLPPPRARKARAKMRIAQVVDVLHCSLLVFTAAFLALIDISWVYHNIRGQSVIKLYVVFNVLEIFDRLCSSFGVDILDSLGWTTASAVSFLLRAPPAGGAAAAGGTGARRGGGGGGGARARAVQSAWLLSRVAVDYLFTLVYVGVHAALLLTWVVTLNVAINTKNNALVTLLVANNFVELKGAVFKSYKVQHVFQTACADGVERFQLSVFLLVMLVYTAGHPGLLVTWAVVYACEVVVDWIKHAFVTKFNRIPHRVYPQFSIVICEDIAHARSHSAVRTAGASAVSKRIGFVSLPLAALVARMAAGGVLRMPAPAVALLFATLVAAKVALSIGLMGHAQRRLTRASQQHNDWPKEEEELESKWYQSLVNVGRYDLITKS